MDSTMAIDAAQPRTHSTPPAAVRWAVLLQGLLAVWSLLELNVLWSLVGLILCGALWGGSLLAQRLTIMLSVVSIGITAIIALAIIALVAEDASPDGLGLLVYSSSLAAAAGGRGLLIYALTRSAARRYFGLFCPFCDAEKVRPVPLTIRRLRCQSCNATWDHGERPQIDPGVFD